jgi:hypothetical protein
MGSIFFYEMYLSPYFCFSWSVFQILKTLMI